MIEQQAFSLYELVGSVKAELKSAFTSPVWVVAEIMEFNANRTGHCYLELVEKDANSDKIIAKSKEKDLLLLTEYPKYDKSLVFEEDITE